MQFMYIIWEDPSVASSTEARDQAMEAMDPYIRELAAKGKYKGSGPLRAEAEGAKVRSKGGEVKVAGGPFSTTSDSVGGYLVIEAASQAEAIELAKTCPGIERGAVEIREIIPLG